MLQGRLFCNNGAVIGRKLQILLNLHGRFKSYKHSDEFKFFRARSKIGCNRVEQQLHANTEWLKKK